MPGAGPSLPTHPPIGASYAALRAAQKEDLSRKPFWTSVARALAANVRLLAARCHLDVSQSEALTPLLNSTFGNLRSIFSSGAEFAPMLAVHCEIIRVAFIFNRINLGFDQLTLFHDQHLTNAPMADRVTFSYYKARLCILENRCGMRVEDATWVDDATWGWIIAARRRLQLQTCLVCTTTASAPRYGAGSATCDRGRPGAPTRRFDEARELLQYALDNCPPGARRNRELILKYLVPINMLQGRMPAAQIMRGPAMQPYLQVATAVRAGNVGALQAALDSNLQTFVRDGTVFLLERLKLLAHRRLLQRVCQIYGGMLGPDADDRVKARLPLKVRMRCWHMRQRTRVARPLRCVTRLTIGCGALHAVLRGGARGFRGGNGPG